VDLLNEHYLWASCIWARLPVLSDLRLAPAATIPFLGGVVMTARVLFHHQRVADVAGMHRADVRGLLLLKQGY